MATENNQFCGPKKRRAAFGDLTNDGVTIGGGKKKIAKKDNVIRIEDARKTNTQIVLEVEVAPTENNEVLVENVENMEQEDGINELCERFDWIDVDKDNHDLPYFVTEYVNDIFQYYKNREAKFVVPDYMPTHLELTANMRAILVDWLVEVQQNFELNHETLYMAVKLVDIYCANQSISKERLQLVGASALNLSCKFEERCPPVLDDYLYVCDDAYTKEDFLEMEKSILMTIDFDLGLPLSYTFLRRYAQCGRVSIPTLTLARYILESSLMDYHICINFRESLIASTCLLLAMRMKHEGQWDNTMVHYTGYELADLEPVARKLNVMLRHPMHRNLSTVLTKYTHPIFHEVAKVAHLNTRELELIFKPAAA